MKSEDVEKLCTDVLEKVDTVLKENQDMKVEIRRILQESAVNQRSAMFGQNIVNSMIQQVKSSGRDDGQWHTERIVVQAKVKMMGDQLDMAEVKVGSDSPIIQAPKNLRL